MSDFRDEVRHVEVTIERRAGARDGARVSGAEFGARRPCTLIVDDEPRNRLLLEVILTQEGHDLLMASDGREALEMVARRRPDLILCDVMMPGMNGYELTAALKADEATRDIPVVLLSSLDDSNSRAHGLAAGASDFMVKPIGRHDLTERVRRLLDIAVR